MLDKLVVSRNSTKENKRIGNFLVTSFLAIVSVLTVGLIYSLFTHNLAMGTENLSISSLVAPVIETEAKPEPPKEEIKPNKKVSKSKPAMITRKTNTQRLDESPVKAPEKVSVNRSDVKARPKGYFLPSTVDSKDTQISGMSNRRGNGGSSLISGKSISSKPIKDSKPITKKPKINKPPVLKKEVKKAKKVTGPVSGGVVNGKALKLVQPIYSAAAKSMNIRGKVTVQVLIDERGNVVSAKAIKGHPLLKQNAVRAARSSKFSPTTLSGQKVKVSGVIVYNFKR